MKIFAITILFLASFSLMWGQEQENRKKIIIAATPQYIINNALHFEIDIPQKDHQKWLVIIPEFYYRDEDFADAFDHPDYNSMIGAGLEFQSRTFFAGQEHGKGFYLSYGAGYRFIQINTDHHLWTRTVENGLDWYRHEAANYDINLHGLLGKCISGYQTTIFDHMYLDAFIGFGIRYSIEDAPEGNFLKFNTNVNDYGFRGMLFMGGVRFGVGW